MAQILVPGVAQAVLSGVYTSQPWALVWHFKYDGNTTNWTQSEVSSLAASLRQAWANHAAALCPLTTHLTSVTTTDIGSTSPAVGQDATNVPGTASGAGIENASICAMMNFHINVRYKGGHPRSYLPWGILTSLANEFTWSTAFQTAANQAIAGMINDVRANMPPRGSSQVSQVCPRYVYTVVNDPVHQKYVRQRTGLKSVDVVTTYSLNPTFGVQRRRLKA